MAVIAATAPGVRGRGAYTSIQLVGLLLIAAAPLVFLVAGLVTGQLGEETGFLVPMIALPAIAAALVWRFGTWAKVLGIVVTLLIAFGFHWAIFGLAYPYSVAEFTSGIALPVGVLTALGGGIAGIAARRRGRVDAVAVERTITRIAIGLVAAALLVSSVLYLTQRGSVDASRAGAPVEMSGFEFAEKAYSLPAGRTTSVEVRNEDPFVHTFTIPELGVDVAIPPRSSKLVEVTPKAAGIYTIYCKPHSDMSNEDPAKAGMATSLRAT